MAAILTPGFLYWDGFKYVLNPGTFVPAGDLAGNAISQQVVGIETHPVPGPTGTNTVLTWTGSAFIWGAGGGGGSVTWANDLVNSTSTNQYVSSLSYSASPAGGLITINGTGTALQFANNNTGPTINQVGFAAANPGTSSTSIFDIAGQPGGNALSGNNAGGNGGAISLAAGVGGDASGSTIGGTGGNITIAAGPGGNSGTNPGSTGGNIIIKSGHSPDEFGIDGNVTITAGAFGSFYGAAPYIQLTGNSSNVGAGQITISSGSQGDTNTNIILTTATGGPQVTITSDTVILSPEGTANVTATFGKFVFNQGWRRHITSVASLVSLGSTYNVLFSDDYIAITTLTAVIQVDLPASPAIGDTYLIKDTVGAAAINNITVSGNGNNVDGSPAYVMTNNFEAIEVTYTGTQWSIS